MRIKVLDHGYVDLIECMGDDAFLAECARMSTDTVGTSEQNTRLVDRLIRDRHTSPIEFGQMVFEVQMPILVMRQWIRHRTGAFNEFSARYTEMPDLFYVPELTRVQYQSTFNKQGSADTLPLEDAKVCQDIIRGQSQSAYASYQVLIGRYGVSRELARAVLPVNFYTKVRWTVNLHNLFHFLKLREDPHAQWEIQQFANAIHAIVDKRFPAATEAFERHIQKAVTISEETAQILATHMLNALGDSINVNTQSPEIRDFLNRHQS